MISSPKGTFWVITLSLLLHLTSLQSFGSPSTSETQEKTENTEKPLGINTILESFQDLREQQLDIELKITSLETTNQPDQEAITHAKATLERVKNDLENVKQRIREVSAGVEAATAEQIEEDFNLNDEFNNLAKPLVDELKEASKDARALSDLRSSISSQERRKTTLKLSLKRIEQQRNNIQDQEILDVLDDLDKRITGEIATLNAKIATNKIRLQSRLAVQKSWTEQLLDSVLDFIKGRGLIILLALLAAFTTFFLLALVHRKLFRRIGRYGKVGSSVSFRVTELLFLLFRAVATIAIVVMLFLAFDDWLLITLAIIFIIGMLWGAKKAIVEGYNKLQLLLNLGQVRQGERVTWNGLPYEVRSLGYFPLIENPWLTNSTVRITIDELGELRMRSVIENEPWFVTKTGDWAVLSDQTYGQITYQSPERVCIQDPGGHTKTIPTADYLALHPTNLSHGYALATTFGIDYSHQSLDYEMVADTFAKCVRTKVLKHCQEEELEVVFAAFKEANTSSLDYIVVAKLAGSTDDRRLPISRALQQGCLDACNQNHWTIPFPQLTVTTNPTNK
ncbi:MAG: hypothetical protein ACSHX6_04555 [Akkermansiaceae bacterium]